MSVVKDFTIIPSFKSACRHALENHTPSDLIYTLGAALYEKSNRTTIGSVKKFYYRVTKKLLSVVKQLRSLENEYYVK